METAKEVIFYGWIGLALMITIGGVISRGSRAVRLWGEPAWKVLLVFPLLAPLLFLMLLLFLSPLWAIARGVIWLLERMMG